MFFVRVLQKFTLAPLLVISDLKYLFLVGGFAESAVVQNEIRQEFGSIIQIIIPQGVAMTILKGKYYGLYSICVFRLIPCSWFSLYWILYVWDKMMNIGMNKTLFQWLYSNQLYVKSFFSNPEVSEFLIAYNQYLISVK